jgi:hypothetical protein
MIIFGASTRVTLLAIVNFVCGNCHQPAAQRVFLKVLRFSLFFIPLFPLSKTRFVDCVYCGASTAITKEQADRYVEFVENAKLEAELDKEFGPENPAPTSAN